MMIRTSHLSIVTAAIIGLLFAGPAVAESESGNDFGTWSFQLENDLFSGTDRHYTNGLRLSWLSPDNKTVEWLAVPRHALETVACEFDNEFCKSGDKPAHKAIRFGAGLGQDIYTPEDRYRTDVVLDDRPYAAWLYGAVSLHAITDHGKKDPAKAGSKELTSAELQIGVVGPWALGEEAQNLIHDIRLIDTFDGWDNQVNNEPGVMFLMEHKWRFASPETVVESLGSGERGLAVDFIPNVGFSLGNVITEARTGGAVRLGWNIPENFGPPTLIQGGAPFNDWDDAAHKGFSAYLFATTEARYVARNIFIDGNTFEDSHSVSRRPFVGDMSLGLSVLVGPVNVTYASGFRTREFDGQDRLNRFGSLTFTWNTRF